MFWTSTLRKHCQKTGHLPRSDALWPKHRSGLGQDDLVQILVGGEARDEDVIVSGVRNVTMNEGDEPRPGVLTRQHGTYRSECAASGSAHAHKKQNDINSYRRRKHFESIPRAFRKHLACVQIDTFIDGNHSLASLLAHPDSSAQQTKQEASFAALVDHV